MRSVIVDTNVAVVANRASDHATLNCVLKCLDRLERIRKKEVILLDDARHILDEYLNNLSLSGQPGAGDVFMKWVWTHQANPRHCKRVRITPVPEDYDFREFPNDPDLTDFDRSDRKFVAVALASGLHPPILNAVDTDWWDYRRALERNGVRIEFVCPEAMQKGRG